MLATFLTQPFDVMRTRAMLQLVAPTRPQLAALGSDGVLINVGRGPLVSERALYDALAGGVIKAAAIDVWYRYPGGEWPCAPSELPFADLPNVLMTPHSSGITTDTFIGRLFHRIFSGFFLVYSAVKDLNTHCIWRFRV